MAEEVPFAIRANYQKKNYNAGIPQGGNTIFDALVDPPTSGVAAQAADLNRATHVQTHNSNGTITLGAQLAAHPNAAALEAAYAHRDPIKQFYDSASIQH